MDYVRTMELVCNEYLRSTRNGNSVYKMIFRTDAGDYIAGQTTPNGYLSYSHWYLIGQQLTVKYHTTPSGRVYFDNMEKIKD